MNGTETAFDRIARTSETWELSISVRLEERGPEVAREPVTDEDLLEARCEAWLEGSLRAGRTDVRFDELEDHVLPVPRERGGGFSGFAVATRAPDGHVTRNDFSVRCLQSVATRAARRLIADGVLEKNALYFYEIAARHGAPLPPPPPEEAVPFRVREKLHALEVMRAPLDELLARAHAVGPAGGRFHPVLYTAAAAEKAERFSRRGAALHPPVESGGVLVGTLGSCPESGEFFVVVCDVIEVTEAEESEFSLYYSGRTWSRIQAIVHAMRQDPARRSFRIVGQAHGHNFLPADGAPPCEACATAEVCSRTSVFVSADDLDWSRAVFARQPWKLCHIYGLNARREEVQGLFGQRDGRLLERGYNVLPEFDPAEWAAA